MRYSARGKALEAYPVDFKGAKKELPNGSCVLHQLCRSFRRKDSGSWCYKTDDPKHATGGDAHQHVKGFKASKYIDRSKERRIVAAATMAAILQGARCEQAPAATLAAAVTEGGSAAPLFCQPIGAL